MLEHKIGFLAALFPALVLPTLTAQATPDTPQVNYPTIYVDCPLERIGSQLVRCDNLTGGGVVAPSWIPEQK